MNKINIYRNPFIVALWTPAYLIAAATTVTNDFLLAAMFILFTVGLLGAYVTEFPILNTLYSNEVVHKTAIASLMGLVLGLIIGLAFAGGGNDTGDSAPVSTQGKFLLTWGVMSLPAYPLKVFLIIKLNKRDLEAEQKIRDEKKKNRKSGGGPPIMDREGF
ncbi:MAG: hypothetical protein V3U37_04315 [Nitrospinaceae bacterium]